MLLVSLSLEEIDYELSSAPFAYIHICGGEENPCFAEVRSRVSMVCFLFTKSLVQRSNGTRFLLFTSSRHSFFHSWVSLHMRSVLPSSRAPSLSSCLLPGHDHPRTLLLHARVDVCYLSAFRCRPSWLSRHRLHPRHWRRSNRMKMTSPSLLLRTLPPRGVCGRCSTLIANKNWSVNLLFSL